MGFWKRGLLVVLLVLFVPIAFSMQITSVSQFGDSLIFPGDNTTFIVNNFAGSPSSCNITYNLTTDPMINNGGNFSYTITNISAQEILFECDESRNYTNFYNPGFTFFIDVYDVRTGSDKNHLMAGVPYVFNITNATNITLGSGNARIKTPIELCDFTMSSVHSSFSFADVFSANFYLNSTCGLFLNFSSSSLFNVSAYGPQLSVSSSNPFASLASSSGFKLGTYDFNLDYVDDLVILTNTSLLIYDGKDVAEWNGGVLVPAYNNTAFRLESGVREFFITDMNWNGKGDILINNATGVYLLTYTSNFDFAVTPVFLSSNVASFGAFDIDGDFLKDVLVVNGSGQSWQFNYFTGISNYTDLISYSYNDANYRCNKILIFDINKNNLQDVICADQTVSSYRLRFYTRDSLITNLSQFNYSVFDLSYAPTDIFFTDITGDGEWELGVRSANNVFFYEIDNSSLSLAAHPANNLSATSISGIGIADLLEEGNSVLLVKYYNSTSVKFPLAIFDSERRIYFNDSFSFLSGFSRFSSNLLLSIFESSAKLKLFNNSISLYRDPVSDYNVDIFLYDLAEDGVENDTTSLNVRFRFENISTYYDDTNQWNYHNYFFVVRFSDRIYRNDFFDSQQNLKYFMVDRTNEYSFNYNNIDEYGLEFSLNKYSMMLTDITNATKKNTQCACFFEGSCNITSFCPMNDFEFNATLNISNTSVTWNNITNVGDIVLTNTTDVVSGSSFYNGSFSLVGGSLRVYTNSLFENMVVEIKDTTVILNEVDFINSAILLNNATVTFNATNGSVTLNNSVIHNYTGNFDVISSENSTIYTYSFDSVSFFDNFGAPVSISGSVVDSLQTRPFATATGFTGWILMPTNFTFNTEFKYFNESVVYDGSNITLTKTHIPTWNYTLNTSHMTNFRNYTLLQNIDNLTGVKLSRPNVNITLDTANFSDMNLLEQFTFSTTSTTATLFVNISNFNLSLVSHLLGEVIVTYNGSAFDTYNSTGAVQTFTNLEPGVYVFSQVLDRFVLGEFSTPFNLRVNILSPSSFASRDSFNGNNRLFIHPLMKSLDFTTEFSWFYYSGSLLNTNETKEVIN